MTPFMDKDKIITHFGEDFYNKILNDIEKYTDLWGLSELKQVDYYSVNCIFTCITDKHSSCILKIGNDPNNVKNEYNILSEYNGTRFCGVFEADIANSVLLIERISPGTQLRAEADLNKRLDLFFQLSQGLHKKPTKLENYPTYMGWVNRITEHMRNRDDYIELRDKMIHAEQICRDLCIKYPGQMLLHGDFHHDNILLDENNTYRIIDPKGVIGDVVFDIPRFILNEFDDDIDENFNRKYTHIIKTFAKKFIIPESDIRKLTYVEMCMGNCWCVESGEEPNMDDVLFA